MLRRLLRFIGFYCLAGYAVLEKSYIDKLIKNGYLDKDAEQQNRRLEVTRFVLTKLKKEYQSGLNSRLFFFFKSSLFMKKQYDKSKCKLLSKDLNVEEIIARNKSVLSTYDFTTVLNAIQQKFNRMQGFPSEERKMSIGMRLIHAVYEDDKISSNLYDKLDNKLLTILRDDFGYECEIQNFGGSLFGSYYLVIHL